MADVVVLHAKALNLERISCQQLLGRGPELAQHLGYGPGGVRKGSWAADGMSAEASAYGGRLLKMKYGGVTASLQSVGATGAVKPEAKRAIAAALRDAGLLADRDYLAALGDRPDLVIVEIPSYFSSPSPELPLLVSDYKDHGYNHRRAEEMLEESRLWDWEDDCPCYRRKMCRIENRAVFERFKLYEAAVANELGRQHEDSLVPGIHPWLESLADKNGLSKVANTVYLLHGTRTSNLGAICQKGLKTKFSLQDRGRTLRYGRGLYFAVNSCKAAQYTNSKQGCVIVCRVVLGRIERLHSQCPDRLFATPPAHSAMAQAGVTRRKHGVQIHDEYIVFNEAAVYPEFVLQLD